MPAEIPQIGGIVRSARKSMGLTQPELAEKSHVSQRTIASVESDESKPSFKVFCQLIDALYLSAEQLARPHRALHTLEDDQFINEYLDCNDHEKIALRDYLRALRHNGPEKQG